MLRKLIVFGGLIVACAGIGVFIGLGTYVWTLKTEVNQQTTSLAKKTSDAGDEANKAIEFVRKVIKTAKDDLDNTRKYAEAPPTRPVSLFEQIAARKASQQLAGSVERAHSAVVTASDAVVIARAALEVFNTSKELKELSGVQPGQVDATQTVLSNVSNDLNQAQVVLGGTPTQQQLKAVDGALNSARGFTDELAQVVTTVRGRVEQTKTAVDRWTLWIAAGTTVLCVLGAVGQLFLARYCWRTMRGLPA
jgi:hydrogenase maturation protease